MDYRNTAEDAQSRPLPSASSVTRQVDRAADNSNAMAAAIDLTSLGDPTTSPVARAPQRENSMASSDARRFPETTAKRRKVSGITASDVGMHTLQLPNSNQLLLPGRSIAPQMFPKPPSSLSRPSSIISVDNVSSLSNNRLINQQSWTSTVMEQPQPSQPRQQGKRSHQELMQSEPTSPPSAALNFPETLYKVIESPDSRGILAWLPDGKGFAIHDKVRFVSRILSRYFENAKFASFTRRLKRWNFKRVPVYPEHASTYRHKYFLRGRPDLVQRMTYGTADSGQLMVEDGWPPDKHQETLNRNERRDKDKILSKAEFAKQLGLACDNVPCLGIRDYYHQQWQPLMPRKPSSSQSRLDGLDPQALSKMGHGFKKHPCFPSGDEQQQCLNDVSLVSKHQQRPRDVDLQALAKHGHNNGARNSLDKISNRMTARDSTNEESKVSFMDALQMNNLHVIANQARLTQKMLALEMSQTHKELMMMTSRDTRLGRLHAMQQPPPQHQQRQAPRVPLPGVGHVSSHAVMRLNENIKEKTAAQKGQFACGGGRVIGLLPPKKRTYRPSAA